MKLNWNYSLTQSHAKGGVDLDFLQRGVAVTCCDRVVSQCDRAVNFSRDWRGFGGSFYVKLCNLRV